MDEAAQAPPVDIDLVAHFLDDLGRQVLGSAADGLGSLFEGEDLGQAEVSEFDVAVFVDYDVLGLQAAYIEGYSR